MTTNHIVFVDTETSGLHPDDHDIWECAAIRYDPVIREVLEVGIWQLPIDLEAADPVGLEIGRFDQRRWPMARLTPRETFAEEFRLFSDGCHLAGAVVSFDEERLRRLLWSYHLEPGWHYHLIDVEILAVGYLNGWQDGRTLDPPYSQPMPADAVSLPYRSDDLIAALGIEIDPATKHTAEGDARWALAMWEACTYPHRPTEAS